MATATKTNNNSKSRSTSFMTGCIVSTLLVAANYISDSKAATIAKYHFGFVSEFIRQLGELERVRENAERENKTGDQIVGCIRT